MRFPERLQLDPNWQLELHGFSPWTPARIVEVAVSGEVPSEIPGNFVLTARGKTPDGHACELIVTSLICTIPYFVLFRETEAAFVHGRRLIDVVRRSGVPWTWNRPALASILALEHTLGEDTLHQEVRQVAGGQALFYKQGQLVRRTHHPQAELFADPRRDSLQESLEQLGDNFDELASVTPKPLLSLSSGLDARVLLALMLSRGIKPAALTMGFEDSSDRVVASKICRHFGLELTAVEVRARDYLDCGQHIVQLTGGAKTASHWHTFIYAHKSGLAHEHQLYVGTGGGFARTYAFEYGAVSPLLETTRAPVFLPIMKARLGRHTKHNPLVSALTGDSSERLLSEQLKRAKHLCSGSPSDIERATEFLVFQRTAHFQAYGQELLRDSFSGVVSPFTDVRWLRSVHRLLRSDRLGYNYHRAALNQWCPALMQFQAKGEEVIARRASPLYMFKLGDPVGYTRLEAVAQHPEVRERILDTKQLHTLFSPDACAEVLERQLAGPTLLLLTLHYLFEVLNSAEIPISQ